GRKPYLECVRSAAAQPGHISILNYEDVFTTVVVASTARAQGEVIPEYREQIVGIGSIRDSGVGPCVQFAAEGKISVGTCGNLRFLLPVERELEWEVNYDA